ncbi:aromatic amino acid lyase [Amycolatopsis orientalis]|uniref:aromatic amino acid lyase n=1 Tax=Amycolatopsis orientalis TaxID=31958 RepID=UPI00056BE26E|nr:aromatic amino acid lyase [Amycolatopsis orientalis]
MNDEAPIELEPAVLERLQRQREAMLAALNGDRPVYGVNTGMGRLAGTRLTAEQQAGHQRNLLVGRAVGGRPWLSPEVTRALLRMRLRGFLRGDAAVSPELVVFLVDRLNDRFLPAVPRDSLGSAGEIVPLAHAFQTFVGLGTVLENGAEIPAAEALRRRGVKPFVLGPKEGASLIQGSPLAEAYAWVCGKRLRRLLEWQTVCAAITVDVLGAPQAIYRGTRIEKLIEGAVPRNGVVQAPISVRVGPKVLEYVGRTVEELRQTLRESWETPADSPAFVNGEFVPTTGYHAVALGLRMDASKAALVHAAEVSVQRLHRLLDPQFSGLPSQLAVDPGPQAGLTPLHKRAAGELHAMRRLAAPATLGSLDTSAGQEDVQAFASQAGAELETAIGHFFAITACELIAGRQARYLRETPSAPKLADTYDWLAARIEPVVVDRSLGPEIDQLAEACLTSPDGPAGAPAREA